MRNPNVGGACESTNSGSRALGFKSASIEPASMKVAACWPAAATLSALSSATARVVYKKSMDSKGVTDRSCALSDRWLQIAPVLTAIVAGARLRAERVLGFALQSLVVF
jgi:hypothetical protein